MNGTVVGSDAVVPVDDGRALSDVLIGLLRTTCRAASLVTLELRVADAPRLDAAVRGQVLGTSRELSVWATRLTDVELVGDLQMIASAPRLDAARRTTVLDTALLVAELIRSDRRRQEAETVAAQAVELAGLDALTDLGNRRTWRRALDTEAARARRYGGCSTVVVVDLDGMKQVNDHFGHASGDDYLRRAAEAVAAAARRVDTVCRLGGDEFGILAPSTDASGAAVLVDRLRRELFRARVPASIGSATTDLADLDAAWQDADVAMYADKRHPA